MNEDLQNQLAKKIQKEFPVVAKPFELIANELNISEDEVLTQLKLWKENKKFREISAVMEGSFLDHDSALVCGKVPKERLDEVAAIICKHPTVTHCYERNHDYNIWFTIAVPNEIGVNEHVKLIEKMTGIEKFHPLRRIETFKIGVIFDLKTKANDTQKITIKATNEKLNANDKEKEIIRTIQKTLPLVSEPFKEMASQTNVSAQEIIDFIINNRGKAVRKYVATFNHRKLGVSFNAMTVWQVDKKDATEVGQKLTNYPEVSHCYSRNTTTGFPYNVYSMIHGPDEQTVKGVVSKMQNELKQNSYLILHSTAEYKKCRLRYYLPELDIWYENSLKEAK